MSEEWKENARALVELLEIDSKPIAVTFTNNPVESDGEKASICQAIKMAAKGKSFVLDAETSTCPGGTWHCGLVEAPSGDMARGIQWFLTEGEKLTHSLASLWRMQELTSSPPTGISERILIGPVEEAETVPDIIMFVCNAEQACRILALDQYWDGIPPKIEMSGFLCMMSISYPLVTGCTNVNFGDWTARRSMKFDPGAVFVSIPMERMDNLVKAIPVCSAGTAELIMPDEIRRRLEGD